MIRTWTVRGRVVALDRPIVMGIINVTPDSFSDAGLALSLEHAMAQAARLVAEGADILDIGGESTRPGAQPVSEAEELRRILPIVRAIREAYPETLMSVDTVKSGVADAAVREGVHIVNDVSGMRLDERMASICARHGVGVVLMHSRGGVADMATYAHAEFDGDVLDVVLGDLRERVDHAMASGIQREHIVIDPGIGFGKRSAHSLRVLGGVARLVDTGFPVVIGASRKRFIGEITSAQVPSARVFGSVGAAVAAYDRGAAIFRVHDVAATRQALDVAAAIRSMGSV
ncbi:MAG: dihydropteroate synthase [Gemmatimonadota bacterium]|nr:dihydropteroate synthase [Gemmatimonadota bacterium]